MCFLLFYNSWCELRARSCVGGYLVCSLVDALWDKFVLRKIVRQAKCLVFWDVVDDVSLFRVLKVCQSWWTRWFLACDVWFMTPFCLFWHIWEEDRRFFEDADLPGFMLENQQLAYCFHGIWKRVFLLLLFQDQWSKGSICFFFISALLFVNVLMSALHLNGLVTPLVPMSTYRDMRLVFAFFLFILCVWMILVWVGKCVWLWPIHKLTPFCLFWLFFCTCICFSCFWDSGKGFPSNNSILGFRFKYWNFSLSPLSRPECVFLIPSCLAYCGIWLLFFVWVAKSRDSLFKLLDFVIKLEVSGLSPSLELVVLLLSFFIF